MYWTVEPGHVRYYQRTSGNLARRTGNDTVSPVEESWHPGPAPGAWVPTDWVTRALMTGGGEWDEITEEQARKIAPAAFTQASLRNSGGKGARTATS